MYHGEIYYSGRFEAEILQETDTPRPPKVCERYSKIVLIVNKVEDWQFDVV